MVNLADILTADIPLPPHRLSTAALERLHRQLGLGLVALLPAGERLGERFEVRELVGVGGYSVVYRAADRSRREAEVAVKVLHPGLSAAERHRAEAAAHMLAAHRHRNVAVVLDAGVHDGQVFIAMEYLPRTLAGVLAQGPVGSSEALRLFQAVSQGTRFLHGRGVVHRDLKPSSVLLAESPGAPPRPRLTDCGLGGYHGIGELDVATLFHMPPEAVEDPSPEIAHDIYALGVLLFQLLAGFHPTASPEAVESLTRRLERGEPLVFAYRATLSERRPLDLPAGAGLRDADELAAIVGRAMHPRSSERYPSVEALQDDLRRYVELLPLAGVRQGPLRRASKYLRRNRDRAIMVALALLVGGVGVGGLSLYRSVPGVVVPVVPGEIEDLEVEVVGEGTYAISELPMQRLGPGMVRLVMRAPGYEAVEKVVDVPPGSRVEVEADLVPERGQVRLVTDPTGARVTLRSPDGEVAAPTMVSPFSFELPTGGWIAAVDADGYLRQERTFEVRVDRTADVALVLDPWLLATREAGAWAHLSVAPTEPPALTLVTERAGLPLLELRDGERGELLVRRELPSRPVAPVMWTDVEGDGEVEAVLLLVDRLLVLRESLEGDPVWQVALDGAAGGAGVVPVSSGVTRAFIAPAAGAVEARESSTGALLWSLALAPGGSEVPQVLHVDSDTAVVRSADGALYGVSLAGELRWEMPGAMRRATAVVEEEGHLVVGATDTSGQFVLVEPGAGRLIRDASEEADQVGEMAVWREGGRWRRLRLEDDGTATVEDLLSGMGVVDVGTFPGARRAWTLAASGGRIAIVEDGHGLSGSRLEEGAARPLFQWRTAGLTDLVHWRHGSDTRVAWLAGEQLVVAEF